MGKIDDRAVGMWENDLFSLQMIGEFFGCSRQAVKKYLNIRGIDTSKRKRDIVCDNCGIEFKRHRAYIRGNLKNYCSTKCFYESIHNPNYNGNRQGQRVARKTVDELMSTQGRRLRQTDVVHHEDGDTTNNDPTNLIVFKNHSDHMRWHRSGKGKSGVTPIWDGRKNSIVEKIQGKPIVGYSKERQLGKKEK